MAAPGRKVVVYGAVDEGWAWVILAAMTLWNALLAGTLKSFGVIYLEFLERYQRGPAATAWLGFSFSFLTTVLAPVSGYIGDQVSLQHQRVIVMSLSILTSVAIAATGSMPTLEGAIVTYGIAGITAAVVDTPILSMIGKYFRKHRFTASGVVFAGSSLGTLVLPPLITLLVHEYSIKGAMMIFGALWLNTFVIGAAIRPVQPSKEDVQNTLLDKNAAEDSTHKISAILNRNIDSELYNGLCHQTQSLDVLPNGLSTFLGNSNLSLDKQLMEREKQVIRSSKSVPSSPHLRSKSNKPLCNSAHDVSDSTTQDNDVSKTLVSHDCSQSRSDLCEECQPKPLSLGKKLFLLVKAYWDFLHTPGLPLLMVSFCCASFAYFNQFFLLPPLAQEVGMSKMQGALLVSISNVTELVSRLIVGVLIDRNHIQKPLLVKVSFVVSAVTSLALTFYPHMMALYGYSVLFGLAGGIFVPLCIPLMVQLVSNTQISSATGIFVLITGIGISLGPPVLGAVREVSGTFTNSFRVCSVFYVIAFVVYLLQNGDIPIVCRKRTHQKPQLVLDEEIA